MNTALNPYATPKAVVADPVASEAEVVRRTHITHEASIKSAGVLFILGGLGTLAMSAGLVIPAMANVEDRPGFVVIGFAVAALGVAYVAYGWGLRALRAWARTPAIVLAAIGLLGFPIGTLINGYILWLVLSGKGRRIFAADYASIVEATPHVKYRTSAVAWIALGLIVALIVLAFLGLPSR